MIKAQPSPIWKVILGLYFERKIKRSLFKTSIRGLENLDVLKEKSAQNIPVIFYCSHSSWWDAAVTIYLSLRILKLECYGMMVESQMEKYQFFKKIGMFSVAHGDARAALESLQYAATLLKNTNRALWIFPQGRIEHAEKRPVLFENGLAILLKKIEKAYFIPVAIRCDFLKEERAECFISIGKAELLKVEKIDLKLQTEYFLKTLTQEIETLREDVVKENFNDFSVLLKGSQSVEKRWDTFKNMIGFKNKKGI
ncbi:MAG: lysophospholipid acyltransferase family protein [Bacteroidota bacterium]